MVSTYVTGSFPNGSSPTIGAAYLTKDLEVENFRIKLQIWYLIFLAPKKRQKFLFSQEKSFATSLFSLDSLRLLAWL